MVRYAAVKTISAVFGRVAQLKKNMQEYLSRLNTEDEKKTVCMMFLQIFFFRPYESGRDFYEEWEERRTQLQSILPE